MAFVSVPEEYARRLSPAAAERLAAWRGGDFLPSWATAALDELIAAGAWEELEDRFFRDVSFGTGGMRGRTIARRPAQAELGPGGADAPAHPAVGANNVNDITIARATAGLFHRVAAGGTGTPVKLVVAHDVRHFSRRFAELTARVWMQLGGEAWLFDGPRSTPQLSFTVRALGADAGVVISASHNPPHDNGYKVYTSDGGQVVPPFADEIVAAVREVELGAVGQLLAGAAEGGGLFKTVPRELEEKYFTAALEVPLDAVLVARRRPRVAFSALHGTGGIAVPLLLRRMGAEVHEVVAQAAPDARFPTVKSPNPEEAEAMDMVITEAKNADLALATDPDADRIGTAFRVTKDVLESLTGNELGALLAEYRLARAKELGWLPPEGSPRCAILKTFVTTPLLDAIARGHGVRCVNTLTGFKWMGAKLHRYHCELVQSQRRGFGAEASAHLNALSQRERAALYLEHSTWVVFAAEESYGCLAGDAVRDKDANTAALLCAELAAWLAEHNLTAAAALDLLYVRHGYHREALRTLTLEGAAGAEKIQRALASLRTAPPAALGGRAVARTSDFLQPQTDEEGEPLPRENFLLHDVAGGWRCAVRGSGTEPKLKLYFFVCEPVAGAAVLPELKIATDTAAAQWVDAVVDEMRARAEA